MKVQVLFLSLVSFIFPQLLWSSTDQSAEMFVLCKNQKDVRSIALTKAEDKTCRVLYTKAGKQELIAQGKNQDMCKDKFKRLEEKLSKAQYTCKHFDKAQISTSSEPESN